MSSNLLDRVLEWRQDFESRGQPVPPFWALKTECDALKRELGKFQSAASYPRDVTVAGVRIIEVNA